jgi:hypothetical protein
MHHWLSAFQAKFLFSETMIAIFVFYPAWHHYSQFDDLFYIILCTMPISFFLKFRPALLF